MKTIDSFHPPQQVIDTFCRESNWIEFEREGTIGKLYPNDIGVCRMVIAFAGGQKQLTEERLLDLHKRVCGHLNVDWAGKFRTIPVFISAAPGHKIAVPVDYHYIKDFMQNLYLDWEKLDSWQIYNLFEHVHPFVDRNGRMGRFLWLWKRLQEGWIWQGSFLEDYHFQTLAHTRK